MKKLALFAFTLLSAWAMTAKTITGPVDYVSPLVGTQSKHALSTGNTYPALHNVVDISKVTAQLSVIEYLYRFTGGDGLGKKHRSHVRTSPGTVYRKIPQAGNSEPVQLAVGMRHQFV